MSFFKTATVKVVQILHYNVPAQYWKTGKILIDILIYACPRIFGKNNPTFAKLKVPYLYGAFYKEVPLTFIYTACS